MTHALTRSLLIVAAMAVPSLAMAHGPGPGNGQAPGWTGQQTPPCTTSGVTVPPCGTALGTGAYGPWGNGMPGPAVGHGPQMMQGFGGAPRQGGVWGPGFRHGPGMNWRN
ncbi:hypothetical protein [Tropicimonas sp. IMCC6043]|uniref:hypothetical protein n=1 Tax=Tropicimonas sp. IMCC6043 TaxID=2510645 RepID=UPI00101C0AA5|nr:hypothetical protein [Tropicimonas sp. IMCC6043]RYH07167.1 hypothetical protein EU800_21085 [Tropicimonas sp. IMCC6043]